MISNVARQISGLVLAIPHMNLPHVSRSLGGHTMVMNARFGRTLYGEVKAPQPDTISQGKNDYIAVPDQGDEPEPAYEGVDEAEETVIYHKKPFRCYYGAVLPELQLAYETWGTLNTKKDNAILLYHGLSASSHARSHFANRFSHSGWWEKFIGPNSMLDTNKYYVVCVNLLGSCFGTSGPSTLNPETGKHFGSDFPIISMSDIVNSQMIVLDHMGIDKLYAVVGSSLGGMASLLTASLYKDRVGRLVTISGGGNASPQAIAYRYLQRVALMADPLWRNGFYYGLDPPVKGMQLARKIATLTYRSGPEWSQRFARKKINVHCKLPRYSGSEFAIEDYIRHQGESFMEKTGYDPNSLLYLSKVIDLFDIADFSPSKTLEDGYSQIKCPTLVMGASSDVLVPSTKLIEGAELIKKSGNPNTLLKVVDGHYGHDTFLLDLSGMGLTMKDFLENYEPKKT